MPCPQQLNSRKCREVALAEVILRIAGQLPGPGDASLMPVSWKRWGLIKADIRLRVRLRKFQAPQRDS